MTFLDDMGGSDLAGMFDDFAVPAIYTSKYDGLKKVSIILDIGRTEINPLTSGYENVPPSAIAMTVDVPKIVHKDTFSVDGVEYEVITASPDGTGVTIIELED